MFPLWEEAGQEWDDEAQWQDPEVSHVFGTRMGSASALADPDMYDPVENCDLCYFCDYALCHVGCAGNRCLQLTLFGRYFQC